MARRAGGLFVVYSLELFFVVDGDRRELVVFFYFYAFLFVFYDAFGGYFAFVDYFGGGYYRFEAGVVGVRVFVGRGRGGGAV